MRHSLYISCLIKYLMKTRKSGIKISDYLTISEELGTAVENFLEQVDAAFFSRCLRYMLIEFMRSDEGKEAFYTDRLLDHLERLYFLLDAIEDDKSRTMSFKTLST